MARISAKRVVAEKVLLTFAIALIGTAIVILRDLLGLGLWAAFVGLLIVLLSPVISYAIIVYRIRRKLER